MVASHFLALSGVAEFTKGFGTLFAGHPTLFMLAVEVALFLAVETGVVVLLLFSPPFSSWLPSLLHRQRGQAFGAAQRRRVAVSIVRRRPTGGPT